MRYPTVNRLFTFACFSTPPALGSVVSFVWHGGALWCLFEIVSGRHRLSSDRHMRLFTILLYTYVAASILSFLVNAPRWTDTPDLIPLATFLLFPFSYSIWSISEKHAVAQATALASMTASYGALVLALVQHFYLGTRVEGGAGNALIFAIATSMAGTVSLAGAFLLKGRWQMPLVGGYFAAFLGVLLSGSRSVWLAMALASLVVLLVCRQKIRAFVGGHLLKMLLVVAVIAAVSSGVLVNRLDHLARDWSELVEEEDYRSSVGLRWALWRSGMEQALQRPLLGSGMQNTRQIIVDRLSGEFDLSNRFTHFHNGFLTILVESGLIGAGAIIGVFLLAGWTALRTLRTKQEETARFGAAILIILVFNYAIGGSFNMVVGHDIIDTLFMIFLIVGSLLAYGTSMAAVGTTGTPAPDVASARQAGGTSPPASKSRD